MGLVDGGWGTLLPKITMDSKPTLQNLETNSFWGKKKNCRQNFIWLLNIPLYLPHPFIFLPSWHSEVQGQQWALITSKSYNCVVFIFEYLTLNHTPLSTTHQSTIVYWKRYNHIYFFTSENQTMCLAKSVKPNSVQRKRHQMALFKIIILTFNFRYDEVFRLCF